MDNETPQSNATPPPPSPPPGAGPSNPPPLPSSFAVPPRVNAGPAAAAMPARRGSRGTGWKIAVVLLSVLLVVVLGLLVVSSFMGVVSASGGAAGSHLVETIVENNHASAKIAVIPVEGIITASSMDGTGYNLVRLIKDQLELAARDPRVKAVLLKVNSPGGEVLASDDIYRAIEEFQEEHDKPVIAAMGSMAASGGYYVSAPCRWIVANELTITGSIGVIMQTYNYRSLMNKVGVRPMVFKSGKFKDMLSGDKDIENASPETKAIYAEEEAMVQKMVNETFQRFKSVVETGRNHAASENASNSSGNTGRKLRSDWASFADGRILSGKEAYEIGFVDETGNWDDAVDRAKLLAGITDANLVTYQVPFSLGSLLNFLGDSKARPVKVDLGLEMPRLSAGLHFLAPSLMN